LAGRHAESAVLALKAGVDVDITSDAYAKGPPEALRRDLVSIAEIDACVLRMLALRERLGLFEDPNRRGATDARATAGASRRRDLAREVARRPIVQRANARGVLPPSPDIRRIALMGPLAAAPVEMAWPWAPAGRSEEAVSILANLVAALPNCRIDHAAGVDITGDDARGISAVLDLCSDADLVVLCVGEATSMSGEAASRADLGPSGRQRALAEAVLDLG
jgi:beta-glucosidase